MSCNLGGLLKRAVAFFLMCFLSLSCVWADAQSLLSQDVTGIEAAVEFRQNVSRSTDSLDRIRLYYMSERDCQTGYMGQYEANTREFMLEPNQVFGLSGMGVYQTAETLFSHDRMVSIRSVLVLFIGKNNQVSRFSGACRDALINCCIPIDCLPDAETCLSSNEIGVQGFFLGK